MLAPLPSTMINLSDIQFKKNGNKLLRIRDGNGLHIIPVTNKYNVSDISDRTLDSITFASKREMQRYAELKLLHRAGEITELKMQVPFVLQDSFIDKWGKRHEAITYVADYTYRERNKPGVLIVEDSKAGVLTPVYKLKKKLLIYKYTDIKFIESK